MNWKTAALGVAVLAAVLFTTPAFARVDVFVGVDLPVPVVTVGTYPAGIVYSVPVGPAYGPAPCWRCGGPVHVAPPPYHHGKYHHGKYHHGKYHHGKYRHGKYRHGHRHGKNCWR
jgi:hypothetical protein